MIYRQKRNWHLKEEPENLDDVLSLSNELGCSDVLASLLIKRGYKNKNDALAFINKSQEILHDPFMMNDMKKAVERILASVKNGEKITIYGDYDVDGVTSVSILYLYLERIGANVDYYIPCRKGEGYGMSKDAVKKLQLNGTKLIITVDTGVTALDEVDHANSCGIDVVVTDHHECTATLPNAVAVVNPKRQDNTYSFANLAGVGVVFKLLCALETVHSNTSILNATRVIAENYIDLTAIGTVADVMPVIDENRIIIALGLEFAEKTKNIGLATLIDLCRNGEGKIVKSKTKKRLTSGFVGFTLAPRINAAGRIASASTAVELFLAKDRLKAERLANELCEINRERQFTENKIAEEAYQMIDESNIKQNSVIVLNDDNWNHGVIGIVSSRVSDKYGVPSVLISFEGNDDPSSDDAIGKGSGRSVSGMNLVDALSYCSDLLEKFGGHELAAGLTIKRKNLEQFKQKMNEYAKTCFSDVKPNRTLEIDAEIDTDKISINLANEILCLEPYGVSNPAPVFCVKNMSLVDIIPVGMNKHLKLILSKGQKQFSAMLFSVSPEEFWLDIGDEIDVAFGLETNEYAGNISIQIGIKDICLSERFLANEMSNEMLYQDAKDGNSTLSFDSIIPEREDFAIVYNRLLMCARNGQEVYRTSRLVTDLISFNPERKFTYIKVKFIIKIFRELNIANIEEIDEFSFNFRLSYSKSKTNLEKSNILRKLRNTYKQ